MRPPKIFQAMAMGQNLKFLQRRPTVTSRVGSAATKNPLDMFSKDPEATETPRFSTSTWVTYLFLLIKIKESA